MRSLDQDASDHVLGVFGKLLTRGGGGALDWLGSMTFGLVMQKFLNGKLK
jgi:hypothetical protein